MDAVGGEGKKTKRRRAKPQNEPTRSEYTTVVCGQIESYEEFEELKTFIEKEISPIRSVYFREHQKCGFVYFHEPEQANIAKSKLSGLVWQGKILKACSPIQYFGNVDDARPSPANSGKVPNEQPQKNKECAQILLNQQSVVIIEPRPNPILLPSPMLIVQEPSQNALTVPDFDEVDETGLMITLPTSSQSESRSSSPVKSGKMLSASSSDGIEPNSTIVLKNLPFAIRQDRLLELMESFELSPQSVNFHYDNVGAFKGVAFAKFKRVDESSKAFELMNGLEIDGRRIKAEFKKKQESFSNHDDNILSALAVFGEVFDPRNMDSEQTEIMKQLQIFKDNSSVRELSFVSSMTMSQRNQVHMIAEYLGLQHVTTGPAEARYVVVSKTQSDQFPLFTKLPKRRDRLPSISIEQKPQQEVPAQPNVRFSRRPNLRTIAAGPTKFTTLSSPVLVSPITPDGTRGFSAGRARRASTPYGPGSAHPNPPPFLNSAAKSTSVPTVRKQTLAVNPQDNNQPK